jgi:hypothetical protein
MDQIFRDKIAVVLGRNLRDYYSAVLKEALPEDLLNSLVQLNQRSCSADASTFPSARQACHYATPGTTCDVV